MVTVKREGKVRIEVRADHNPPHFHVTSPDSNFMVDLASFAVMRGSGSSQELAWAIAWAKDHATDVKAKWSEINEPE